MKVLKELKNKVGLLNNNSLESFSTTQPINYCFSIIEEYGWRFPHKFHQNGKKKRWFRLVSWHINHRRLFNAKSIFILINSSISNHSV